MINSIDRWYHKFSFVQPEISGKQKEAQIKAFLSQSAKFDVGVQGEGLHYKFNFPKFFTHFECFIKKKLVEYYYSADYVKIN